MQIFKTDVAAFKIAADIRFTTLELEQAKQRSELEEVKRDLGNVHIVLDQDRSAISDHTELLQSMQLDSHIVHMGLSEAGCAQAMIRIKLSEIKTEIETMTVEKIEEVSKKLNSLEKYFLRFANEATDTLEYQSSIEALQNKIAVLNLSTPIHMG
jgi:uncharacterized coiled-coil protein SlyX